MRGNINNSESGLRDPDLYAEEFVKIDGLKKYFPIREGILNRKAGNIRAVDGVSINIPKGKTFGLVGESGSGKTTVGKTILRIEEPTSGEVRIGEKDITSLSQKELKNARKDMQMVFQDPTSSLNPRKRILDIISAPMEIYDIGDADERVERVENLMETVGLPKQYMYRYPSALSGGQKQRVNIARAVILNPEFLVLDEPTSALDVSVQARIVDLFKNIQKELDITYLFITHDLSLIRNVADWIGIMYLGRIVEVGPIDSVFRQPYHPYTRALFSAIPTVTKEDAQLKPSEIKLKGEIPDPREKPSGCAFRSRCPEEFDICSKKEPQLYEVKENHHSRCYLHDYNHVPENKRAWLPRDE